MSLYATFNPDEIRRPEDIRSNQFALIDNTPARNNSQQVVRSDRPISGFHLSDDNYANFFNQNSNSRLMGDERFYIRQDGTLSVTNNGLMIGNGTLIPTLESLLNDRENVYKNTVSVIKENMDAFDTIKQEHIERMGELDLKIETNMYTYTPKFDEFKNVVNALKSCITPLKEKYDVTNQEYIKAKNEYDTFVYKILDENGNVREKSEDQIRQLSDEIQQQIEEKYTSLNIEQLKQNYLDAFDEYGSLIMKLKSITGTVIPTTVCQICLENQVEYFLDPCGHTICGTCKQTCENSRKNCHYCRKNRNAFKRLFL